MSVGRYAEPLIEVFAATAGQHGAITRFTYPLSIGTLGFFRSRANFTAPTSSGYHPVVALRFRAQITSFFMAIAACRHTGRLFPNLSNHHYGYRTIKRGATGGHHLDSTLFPGKPGI